MNFSRRMKIFAALAVVGAFWFGTATADYCWNGHGYSKCLDQVGP